MPTRQANGARFKPLTATQLDALKWHTMYYSPSSMHGVYRSLIIRGYLRPHKYGYELTPEGRKCVESVWWNLT